MQTLSTQAMLFAKRVHEGQVRKYTGLPYFSHLAEVAGIAMSAGWRHPTVHPDVFMATAWLHDSIEDQSENGVSREVLHQQFGSLVSEGVVWLTDVPAPHLNRAQRKQDAALRLGAAPGWVQSIKCADIISNLDGIAPLDPDFAKVYKAEKRNQLKAMDRADPALRKLALSLAGESA